MHDLDKEIARLEEARASVIRDGLSEDRQPDSREYSHSHRGGGLGTDSWER